MCNKANSTVTFVCFLTYKVVEQIDFYVVFVHGNTNLLFIIDDLHHDVAYAR